jgi:hypothetical protein
VLDGFTIAHSDLRDNAISVSRRPMEVSSGDLTIAAPKRETIVWWATLLMAAAGFASFRRNAAMVLERRESSSELPSSKGF